LSLCQSQGAIVFVQPDEVAALRYVVVIHANPSRQGLDISGQTPKKVDVFLREPVSYLVTPYHRQIECPACDD
jgi:hypothetical protein